MTTHVLYLRHGETELNEDNKTRGNSEIPLSPEGIKQAKKAAKELKKIGIDVIYSSPLPRILQTAEIVAKELGKKVNEEIGINALNYGDLEGKDSTLTEKIVVEFIKHDPLKPIGGDGESFWNFRKRYLDTFLRIVKENQNKRILIVSSSTGDKLMRAWIKAGAKADYSIDLKEWMRPAIKNGEFHHWYGIWSTDMGLL